jgi:lipopolysaccharide/colanic/teichoic acid biosynthesis glycosyltransferase
MSEPTPPKSLYTSFGKRALDFVLSLVLLGILSPLLLGAAAMVRLRDPGPVFFRQERVGKDMKPFRIFKFRTMRLNTEKTGTGSVTVKDDPRLYRGAAFLRATKLDEMPQLLNIVSGDMSFVGPRPTVMEDYDRMTATQRRRALVPPGLTGFAQINGNTGLTWPKRIEHDLRYVQSLSLWTDIKTLFQTAWLVVARRAETHPDSSDEWSQG